MRPAVFDCDVLTFDEAAFLETLAECRHKVRNVLGRQNMDEADDRHRRLLCPRRERPRHRRAGKRDELAPLQLTELHPLSPTMERQHSGLTSISQGSLQCGI